MFSRMTDRRHHLSDLLAAQRHLHVRVRFQHPPHVGECPALDDGERLQYDSPFLQLAQDVGDAGVRGDFVAARLDGGPAVHAQIDLDRAPVV
jgi:hypothetical protein